MVTRFTPVLLGLTLLGVVGCGDADGPCPTECMRTALCRVADPLIGHSWYATATCDAACFDSHHTKVRP